jgi:heme a synthase
MNQEDIKKLRRFRRWGIVTVVATIFLIWVGGWVRSTGSGMGCPDWPKCFDVWVPPTSEAQLPSNYREHYVEVRKKKNARVAKTLARMGFTDLATKIENDPSVFEPETFNFYKTWTEYINRVIGVLVGFFIFLTVIFAWPTRRIDKRLFRLSLAGFIGVAFEGWLGSLVVSTNLMPSFISVHMVIAMLILVVLIAAVIIAYIREGRMSDLVYLKPMGQVWLGVGVSALVLIQIIIGTQVRESIDLISKTMGETQRHLWVENLPTVYTLHRLFYYVVAASVMLWVWRLRSERVFKVSSVRLFSIALLGVLISEIALGIGMHRFGIPPILQPFHLLFGTLLFAASFTVTALIYYIKPL